MRAVRLLQKGSPKDLKLEELPDPAAPEGGTVVRLHAAALNHRDVFIMQGLYAKIQLPCVLGSDGAGVVESVGKGVDPSWVGRRVLLNPQSGWGPDPRAQGRDFLILGMPEQGTLAERIAMPVGRLQRIPDHLSFEEAAALPLGGLTAYRALVSRGELRSTDHLLITGIGGGVATLALIIARALGADVSVTSGSEAKLARAKELGAAFGISYKTPDWEKQLAKAMGRPPSLILDSAGGDEINTLVNAVAPGGTIVFYGATRGKPTTLDMPKIFFKQLDLRGTSMGTDGEFADMVRFFTRTRAQPVIDRVFPLSQAAEAMQRMMDAEQMGKIVLDCTK
jgi:NADPH:quinone reductase-like Zn-dependent oxidoreductase